MRSIKALWSRFRGVFVRRKTIEFDAELECHIAMDSDEAIRAGLSKDEGHRQAVPRLGGAEQTRQVYRDRATLPPVESFLQDVRFAFRQMRRAPGFTVTAVLTLALGIGAVAGNDSLVPVTRVRTLDDLVSTSVAAPRALAVLLLGFGGLAVIIGAVGVYSLIAYTVSWRTREIGLRLALGAQRWQIVLSVVRQSLILAGARCIMGLAVAVALSRLLHSFLFEGSVLDPLTFGLVPLLMTVVALIAAWILARRAAAVDPMEALRAD